MSASERDAYAARMRAAQAFADLSREKLAAELGMSVRNLNTLKAGRGPIPQELRQRIAHVCGVPEWFMEHGFSAEYVEPDTDERLEALAHHIETQDQVLAHIREIVAARADVLEQQAREIIRLRGWLEDLAGRVTQSDPGAAVERETAAPLPQPSPSRSPSNGPAGHAR